MGHHRTELGRKPDVVAVEDQRRRSHRRGLVDVTRFAVVVVVLALVLVVHRPDSSTRRRVQELASSLATMGHQKAGPAHKGLIGDKERVVDQLEKDELVRVDLLD